MDRLKVIIQSVLEYAWAELLYFVFVFVYLIKLNRLNQILNFIEFANDFELIQYDGNKPLLYFAVSSFCVAWLLYTETCIQ